MLIRAELAAAVSDTVVGALAGAVAVLVLGAFVPRIVSWVAYRRTLMQVRGRLTPAPVARQQADVPGPIPADLRDALAAGRCVLFAGAGIAAQAGQPTWHELLGLMLERFELAGAETEETDALHRQLDAGNTELVSELLLRRVGRHGIAELVDELLLRPRIPTRQPRTLQTLGRLPFAGAVTNNWDTLLEQAFDERNPVVFAPPHSKGAADALRAGQMFILKLYGSVRSPMDLLFTAEDYRTALDRQRDLSRTIASIVTGRTLLFLGASIAGIEEFLSGIRFDDQGVRHFALVPHEPDISLQEERLRDRYNVQLLTFDSSEGYGAVAAFIDELQRSLPSRGRRPRSASIEPERLSHVELRNIGPFEALDLELASGWTVLLGDNASGKTTILRAIALGLSGDSPETTVAPRRLLKSGASSGSITLRFGSAVYRTHLRLETDRVRVEADGGVPVQIGIAFPALRGVVTEGSSASTSGAYSSGASDLLPLLRGAVDERLTDVQRWIFTNWLLAQDHANHRRHHHAQMVESFFTLVRRLTPGVEFRFIGVDRDTREIRLASPDGVVDVAMLSQGMSAVFAWVGTLLERLYDATEGDADPVRCDALVLVDEIDAHLHPEWQRRFLAELRRMFPRLQLIATTHSPLIVGDTDPGEVVVLERDRDGSPRQRRLDVSLRGMRADQILTSGAFDLTTTRDVRTSELLNEYRDLMRSAQPGEAGERVEQLRDELRTTLPSPREQPLERDASTLVGEELRRRVVETIRELPFERREALEREVNRYLAELGKGGPTR